MSKINRLAKPISAVGLRSRRKKGAALVEGTLVLLTVVLMTVFVMDMGQMLIYMQLFSDRARDAARFSAVNVYDQDAIESYTAHFNASAPNDGGDGLLGLNNSYVEVERLDQGGDYDRIEVRIENFPLQFFTPIFAGKYQHRPFRAVMPVESLGATN